MFKDIKILGKETGVYGLSTVLARFLNFLLVPFYTYCLAPAEYGVVSALFSYVAFFNIVYLYGMDQAYLRFAAQKGETAGEAFSTPVRAVAVSSAVISAVLWLGSGTIAALCGIGRENSGLVSCCAAMLALDAVCAVPFARLRLEHKAWRFVGVRTAGIIVNVAANIILLAHFRAGAKGVFIAGVIASAATLLFLLPEIKSAFSGGFSRELFKQMKKFGWPFLPSGLAAMVVQVADRPIVLFMAGAAAAGVYQANYRLGIFMMLVAGMFDQAWRPFFLERAKNPGAQEVFARVLTYFALAGTFITLAVSFFIKDIVAFSFFGYHLIHPAYWGGLNIVPVILASYLFYGFYINFMAAPVISGVTKPLVWITAAGAAVNVAANLVLIKPYGITGAAFATLASYLAMAFLLFAAAKKSYPVPYEYGKLARILFSACAAWVCCVLSNAVFYAEPSALLLAKAVSLAIFPAALAASGFFRR